MRDDIQGTGGRFYWTVVSIGTYFLLLSVPRALAATRTTYLIARHRPTPSSDGMQFTHVLQSRVRWTSLRRRQRAARAAALRRCEGGVKLSAYLINHLRIPGGVPNEEGLSYLEQLKRRRTAGGGWRRGVQVFEGSWPGSVSCAGGVGRPRADRYQSMMAVLRWLAHARGEVPTPTTKGLLWKTSSAASSPPCTDRSGRQTLRSIRPSSRRGTYDIAGFRSERRE